MILKMFMKEILVAVLKVRKYLMIGVMKSKSLHLHTFFLTFNDEANSKYHIKLVVAFFYPQQLIQ